MCTRDQADQADVILAADQPAETQDLGQEHQDDSKDTTERETGEGVSPCDQLGSADGEPAVPLRRSARKRTSRLRPQSQSPIPEAIETGRPSEAIR
jgi:hypothetical protein